MKWPFILITIGIFLAVSIAGVLAYGAAHWNAETRALRDRLVAARIPIQPEVVDFRELEGLPDPVQRYFRAVLTEGRPLVAGVKVRHRGTFNLGQDQDQWKPFTSDQWVITQRPGFDWNGRVRMAPGLPIRVHDAYIAGEGILHAALLGLISVVDLRGTGDIARGELMRFFAEAAWYPTALLPSQGLRWEAAGDRSALGTLTDGSINLTMRFIFDEQNLIDQIQVDDRGRTVNGTIVSTPWQGRFWDYEKRGDMQIPLRGEVAWVLPEGIKPYWRGQITDITYKFARDSPDIKLKGHKS